ncbi:MAG: hypothetical protein OXG87_16965 [Gemmatimonadetes bacterium]|nr:hypothetical protein [Gemmatimonadota bacterium]
MTENINRLFRDQLPEQRIAKIEPLCETRAHTVWKVTADRSVFAVKHHLFASLTRGKPYHLLAVEQKVTNHLLASGVSVPRIIATDPDGGLVIYEWCGNHTLDDICQTADPSPFAPTVINTLCALEKAFYKHRSKFIPHIAPGCSADDLREQWHNTTQSLTETLPSLVRDPNAPDLPSTWETLVNELSHAPPVIGPTDYNARNIACPNPETATVLELAKIGYDWPERRLVQYTTSLGAHNPRGHIIALLTPSLAQYYAHLASKLYSTPIKTILLRLDAHHLIYHLFAAHICLTTPHWQNIKTRIAQHKNRIAYPLSDHPLTNKFRAYFRQK